MINEIEGFSIIINAHAGHRSLLFTYKSIKENSHPSLNHEIIVMLDNPYWELVKVCQENRIPYFLVDNRCPYKTWRDGAKLATRDWFCFFPEDMYAIKGWDIGLCYWGQGFFNRGIWNPVIIEYRDEDCKGVIAFKEAGRKLEDLNEEKLNDFVKERWEDNVIDNDQESGWVGPYVMHRYWYFNEMNEYPICENMSYRIKREFYNPELKKCKGGCGFDNNFREIARQRGIPFHLCLNSFLFHEQLQEEIKPW